MKVLVCDPVADNAIERMRDGGLDVTVKTGMTPEELLAEIPRYHGAVVRSATKLRKEAIDAAKELKVIVRGGVGIDNIDHVYAREKGVEVRNTPGASSASVGELALGHMLALARHIHIANVTMRAGEWNKKQYKGVELAGKTAGILGLGRIGRETARLCQAMRMRVLGHDPYITESPVTDVSMVTIDELLAESDFISMHIPFDSAKGPVIGKAELAKMKKGSYLVNCARGGTLDESALLEALESGHIAGAALDVFESEPPKGNPLVSHPRVSVTPHIGASTLEAQDRIGVELADILIAFAKEHGI